MKPFRCQKALQKHCHTTHTHNVSEPAKKACEQFGNQRTKNPFQVCNFASQTFVWHRYPDLVLYQVHEDCCDS